MKGKIKILLAALIIPFLSSCLDESNDTIIMEDEEVEKTGIYRAVPQQTVNALKEYMPIYEGNNPPNIEGCYLIKPMVAVYCEDGGYNPGDEVVGTYINFTNQNNSKGTIDYKEKDIAETSHSVGEGAFISGDGKNFTAYFDTDGEYVGEYGTIKFTEALVISGIKTTTGISDIKYAFIMVKKVGDKEDELMDEGVYRVFKDKDGLAQNSIWTYSKKAETSISSLPRVQLMFLK